MFSSNAASSSRRSRFGSHYLLALLLGSLASASGQNCGCYKTNGSTPAYFTNHIFQDFRSLTPSTAVPAVVSGSSGQEAVTSSFFSSAAFTDTWSIQSWSSSPTADSPILDSNSAQNVFIQQDSATSPTYLSLRSTRVGDFQSSAEIDSNFHIFHASIRLYARVTGAAGACAGMFTYADDSNESDIEVLTADPSSQFHATNQPGGDPGATEVVTIANPWTEWNEWRLDWLPTSSQWAVNGQVVDTNTVNIPQESSLFILNMWSNGGTWSGAMAVGDAATLEVQWVEIAYNTTAASGGSCANVCNIDGVAVTGTPEAEALAVSPVAVTSTTTTSTASTTVPTTTESVTPKKGRKGKHWMA